MVGEALAVLTVGICSRLAIPQQTSDPLPSCPKGQAGVGHEHRFEAVGRGGHCTGHVVRPFMKPNNDPLSCSAGSGITMWFKAVRSGCSEVRVGIGAPLPRPTVSHATQILASSAHHNVPSSGHWALTCMYSYRWRPSRWKSVRLTGHKVYSLCCFLSSNIACRAVGLQG